MKGKAPDEGTSKSMINAFTQAASIKDALVYANIDGKVDLSKMIVTSDGTILDGTDHCEDADENNTKWLSETNYAKEGSLRALYVKGFKTPE